MRELIRRATSRGRLWCVRPHPARGYNAADAAVMPLEPGAIVAVAISSGFDLVATVE